MEGGAARCSPGMQSGAVERHTQHSTAQHSIARHGTAHHHFRISSLHPPCLLEALQDAGLAAAALTGGLQVGIPRQRPGVTLDAA